MISASIIWALLKSRLAVALRPLAIVASVLALAWAGALWHERQINALTARVQTETRAKVQQESRDADRARAQEILRRVEALPRPRHAPDAPPAGVRPVAPSGGDTRGYRD